MNKHYWIPCVVAAMCVSGCATVNTYSPPAAGPTAAISGVFHRAGWFDWEDANVQAVDDKYVSSSYWVPARRQKVALSAGQHTLLVHAEFNRQFGGNGPFDSFIAIHITAEADKRYRLNCKVHDNVIEAWVEDASTSARASDVFMQPFHTRAQQTYVPIYVPSAAGGSTVSSVTSRW